MKTIKVQKVMMTSMFKPNKHTSTRIPYHNAHMGYMGYMGYMYS